MISSQHPSNVTLFVFALAILLLEAPPCKGLPSPPRYTRRCGHKAKEFFRWICSDDSFDFPFPFHREHIIIRYPPPKKSLYPFQHQASVCCRRGCQEIGFSRICGYHKVLKKCESGLNHRTVEGRRKRADCLLEVDSKLQPTGNPRPPQQRHRAPFELSVSAVRRRRSLSIVL